MNTNISQLQFECDKWKRLIEFMQLENAYCKNRLSNVVRNFDVQDGGFLEQAEYYQNYYIQQDMLLAMLRSEIYEFEKQVQKETFFDGYILKEVQFKQRRLRNEIDKVSSEFHRGNKLFNDFLEANS